MAGNSEKNSPNNDRPDSDAAVTERVQLFVEELPHQIVDLHLLLVDHDVESIARLAHRIRESARGLGFGGITQAAAQVESSAELHEDLESLSRQVQTLAEMCNCARAAAGNEA